jgi:hypothetical protein
MGLGRLREKRFDSRGSNIGTHRHALPLLDFASGQKRDGLTIRDRRRVRFAIADDQLSVGDGYFPARAGNSANPTPVDGSRDMTKPIATFGVKSPCNIRSRKTPNTSML